jgi:hypothetical protein
METKQTAVEWLFEKITQNGEIRWRGTQYRELFEQAKQMEKEQGIELIKDACMYQVAGFYDKDIAAMTYEDVYNTYYNKN